MDSLLGKLKIIIKKKGLIVPDAISRIKSFFNSSTCKRDYRSVPNAEKDVVILHSKGNILNVLIMITIDWVHVNNQSPKNIQ